MLLYKSISGLRTFKLKFAMFQCYQTTLRFKVKISLYEKCVRTYEEEGKTRL